MDRSKGDAALNSLFEVYDDSVDAVVGVVSGVPDMVACDGDIASLVSQRKEIVKQLAQVLAAGKSIRYKDFDGIISSCCAVQDKCYSEVHDALIEVLQGERRMVVSVREGLALYREMMRAENNVRMDRIREYIQLLIFEHKERSANVRQLLDKYRAEQQCVVDKLRCGFEQNKAVRLSELVRFMDEVEARHLVYLEDLEGRKRFVEKLRAGHQARKREVEEMLERFRRERRSRG